MRGVLFLRLPTVSLARLAPQAKWVALRRLIQCTYYLEMDYVFLRVTSFTVCQTMERGGMLAGAPKT